MAWENLNYWLGTAVLDLRHGLNTQAVPFNLIDTIETLEWIAGDEPRSLIETDATILTIRDAIAELADFTSIVEGTFLADILDCTVRRVSTTLAEYIG